MSVISMHPQERDDHWVVTGTAVQSKIRENPYSNNVLVGNWYEERFADKSDKKAIAPCIYGQSSCFQGKPLYKRDFTQPVTNDSPDLYKEYIEWKQKGFSNRLNGEATNIKLWDGEQFEKNITTTNDLMYRILPKQMKTPAMGLAKEDFMRGYGNSTKTGLLQWRSCEQWQEDNAPIDMTHYRRNFKRIPLHRKPPMCKGPLKKTSIL